MRLDIIQEGDTNPYYVVEVIENIDTPANRMIFTKEFWESFLKKLKRRPIPGSKDGHETSYLKNPPNDLYLIGGEIKDKKVYLKNYIPPDGATTSNKGFIRDIKAGLIHFSIVSYTEDELERDENGFIKSIKAVKSVKGERNDAVEVDLGAMKQKVSKSEKTDNIKQQNTGGYIMPENELQEIMQNLNNQLDRGKINIKDIAKQLKINIVQPEHTEALKLLKDIREIVGDDPVKVIKQMKDNAYEVKRTAYDNKRENLMSKEFGPEKINHTGKEEENLKRQAAEPYVSKEIISDEELKQQIEKVKENPVVKKLSFNVADYTSEENDLTGVVNQQQKKAEDKYSGRYIND